MNIKARQIKALQAALPPMERLRRGLIGQATATPPEAIEGGAAYEALGNEAVNPYPTGTRQHEDWAWGFSETQYREYFLVWRV